MAIAKHTTRVNRELCIIDFEVRVTDDVCDVIISFIFAIAIAIVNWTRTERHRQR